MDGVRFLQIILILIPFLVAIYLLRLSKTLSLEKRLADFAITSHKDYEISFFDKMNYYVWKFIRRLSKLLKKSVVLRNLFLLKPVIEKMVLIMLLLNLFIVLLF